MFSFSDRSSQSMYINWKAILFFAVLAGALGGGVHGLHLWQVARHTPLVLEEAKKRAADGQDAAALAYYQTYLGYRPDDLDAIAEHGLLKAKVAKNALGMADAFYALLQALPKMPQRADVRRELVTLGVKLGRVRDCKEELDALLKESPDDLDVLKLAARGAVQLRQFDAARVRFETLLERGADEKEIYLELMRLLTAEIKDTQAADAVLTRLLKRYPDSVEIRVMAGAYYYGRDQMAEADEQISVAINDLQATDPSLFRLQAEIAKRRHRPIEYQERLKELEKSSDSDLNLNFQLAESELSQGRLHQAQERFLRIARHEQATAEQVWMVITLLAGADLTDNEPELRERLKQLDTGEKFSPSLAMLDRMRQQDWPAALELSRGLLKQTNVPRQFTLMLSLWRAECYGRLGDVAEQINCYRRAIDAHEKYLPARSRLAQLLFRTGQFQAAQNEYAVLIQQQPMFAREFVTELLQAQAPEAPKPMSAVEVERIFSRWRELAPNDATPVLCQMDLLQRKGETDRLAKLITEGLQKWPKELSFRLAHTDGLMRRKAWADAWSALDQAEQQCGVQPALLIRRVLCLEGLDPEDRTERLIACAAQFAKFDRDGQALAWPVMLRGLQQAGVDPQAVQGMLDEYGDKNPGDALARLVRLQYAVAAGDLLAARRHLAALRSDIGEESPSYRLASILCDVKAASQGDAEALSRARTSLEAIRESSPQMPPQLLTLGAELDLLQQRPADALANLQEAIRSGDARSATLIRTVALMVLSGQLDQTVAYLRTLERPSASDDSSEEADPPKTAGLVTGRRDLASLRTSLAAAASESWPVALTVSRIDQELQQPDRAKEMIQFALKTDPKNLQIWANWLAFLERHQPDRLDQALKDVEDQLSLVEQARLLPAILLRRQRVKDAETLLIAALEEAPNDPVIFRARVRLMRQRPGKEQLEPLLSAVMARQDAESAPVREVARRELARLKSVSRDYRIYREAVALAEEITQQAAPGDDEAWMLQGEVNAAHAAHWQTAVAAYEKLAASSRPEVQAEALAHVARIHEQHRHWNEQGETLESLRQLTPGQPQLLIQLLLNAVRRKDAEVAESVYQELTSLVKDEPQLLLCEVLRSTLNDDHTEIVSKILAAEQDGRVTVDTAYEWLNLFKAYDECDALLKQHVESKKPEALAKYALFLASRGRTAEAVPLLSQLWKSGARDSAASVAMAMTASPVVVPADLEAVRTAVLKLAERDDVTLPMLIAAAALEDHALHHAEAMDMYRRILAKSPDSVVALNNLAFLEAISDVKAADIALKRIRHAQELSGPNDQLLDTEGVVLLRKGDAEAARDCFEKAWGQRPEMNYQAHLGWTLTELGQFDAAADAFQKVDAAELPPRFHPLERPLDEAWRKQLRDKQPKN